MNTQEILQLAKELGFDAVGITKPNRFKAGEDKIEQWVSEGRHAELAYMRDFAKRKARLYRDFPDAKSLIVLGVNYFSHESSVLSLEKSSDSRPMTHDSKLLGRVARYAWGQDYHHVIAKKHQTLIEKIREKAGPEFKAQSCVDTQPIPERFAAAQAGLGFIGKHTGLLSTQFGPWLFLSEILTNLDLEETPAEAGDCGTCVHCQKVCPTGALDQDYQIDARKCIAYWTIEHQGVIPVAMRPLIKDWIFGCDECFAVCPFNSKAQNTQWKELTAESGTGPWLDIRELFELRTNGVYQKKFRSTSLMRLTRKQMLRNACVVLGNCLDVETIGLLHKALNDPAPLVRLHAAWALGRFNLPKTAQMLVERKKIETDPLVLTEIEMVLNFAVHR